MRFALRSTLLLLALYAVAVASLFVMVDQLLQDAAWEAMEETAGVVGEEVVRALAEPLKAATLGTDQQARERLREQVGAYVASSPVISGAVVVDTYGQVVVPVDRPAAATYRTPKDLFGVDRRPRLVRSPDATLRSGTFVLQVPVHEGAEPMGYVQLSLASSDIAQLFDDARRSFLLASGVGLVIIGALGFSLHLHLTGRERSLVKVLDRALEGGAEEPLDVDEEPTVVRAAERLGDALRRERKLRDATSRSISQIGRLLDVGVVLAGPDGRLEFIEPHARRLLGLPADAEREWTTLVDQVRPALERAKQDGRHETVDVELPAGVEAARRVRMQVIPTDGNEAGFVVVVRDRAILKAIQTDLRMAAQLRNLTRLYLGVAHDLKAPLNAMVLNVQLLKQSLLGNPPPGVEVVPTTPPRPEKRWIEVLERELARLHRGLEVVLAQTAPSHRERQRYDLRKVATDVVELLTPQARQQKVKVVTRLPEEPVEVHALRDVIMQAVVNLCINSLEAMPSGGELAIVAGGGHEGSSWVAVEDTGPGISADVRDRIFELHVTSKSSGTGIGLYVARNVVEGEGGTLSLSHTGPSGTRFELRLPAAEDVPTLREIGS